MRKCRHVNRRGDRANKEAPRADVTNCDDRGNRTVDLDTSLTESNGARRQISIHLGFGGSGRDETANHVNRVSIDLSVSGDLDALAAHGAEVFWQCFERAFKQSGAGTFPSPIANKPQEENESESVLPDQKAALSFFARLLLEKLVEFDICASGPGFPQDAWLSLSAWFKAARIDRHRGDALTLISELTHAGLVEVRSTPMQVRYKATRKARRFLESLRNRS